MKKSGITALFTLLLVVLSVVAVHAQRSQRQTISVSNNALASEPKLVVGIVVDQMRYDYLTRFWDHYGEGGFKRMIGEGFNCKNNHFNYTPTYTGPGHASVYTGTTPAMHGIISNSWYDKTTNKAVYCAGDDNVTAVGADGQVGQMSPHRMNVTTITDQLRLHTQLRGKVIAVALKDRGAVLPGGHTANGAYWFHGYDKGHWITSSFYMEKLPKWVLQHNSSDAVEQYKKSWKPFHNLANYKESGPDNTAYESSFNGESAPVFPHNIPDLWDANDGFEIIKFTPYGNSITTDFAIAALDGEQLGSDEDTDFLAISYSSTDYIGHKFGVNSKEVQDTYVWLDRDIENLLNALDEKVGQGAYTVFLTSDHGAVHVPAYLADQKIPAGYTSSSGLLTQLNGFLRLRYGNTEIIENISNNQIFLNRSLIKNLDMDLAKVQEEIALETLSYPSVHQVYTAHQMMSNDYQEGVPRLLQNGFNQKRSGDVLFVFDPGTVIYPRTGSTHGTALPYDTHVPLIFMGHGVKRGETYARTHISDIAPTVSSLLGIAFPNGSTGKPIEAVLE